MAAEDFAPTIAKSASELTTVTGNKRWAVFGKPVGQEFDCRQLVVLVVLRGLATSRSLCASRYARAWPADNLVSHAFIAFVLYTNRNGLRRVA
jgi:hypothetical protein